MLRLLRWLQERRAGANMLKISILWVLGWLFCLAFFWFCGAKAAGSALGWERIFREKRVAGGFRSFGADLFRVFSQHFCYASSSYRPLGVGL